MDIESGNLHNGSDKAAPDGLTTVPTHVTLSSEQFERLYLSPLAHHRQPALTKKLGNPTPL